MDNLSAFLDTIAVSEIGSVLLAMPVTDRGYKVLVGATPENPTVFASYADHPRKRIYLERLKVFSTAAGRYQILAHIFDSYKASLKLSDFSPASQDRIAVQLIRERHGLELIASGDFAAAVRACSTAWASLPGSAAGQHVNQLEDLRLAYEAAGGQGLQA